MSDQQIDVDRVCDGNTLPAQIMGKRVTKKSKAEFAARLKAWRQRKNLSQSKAAELIGLDSVRTLQNWEIERTSPQGAMKGVLLRMFDAELPSIRPKRSRS